MSNRVRIVLTCCTFIGEIISVDEVTRTILCDDGTEEICWKHLTLKVEIV